MKDKNILYLYGCLLIASIATLGSLFFSEVMEFPPCSLCWYQRIAMYPLVPLFTVAVLGESEYQRHRLTVQFTFPLVIIGLLIAVYHNLLQYDIIPESAAPCQEGIPCSLNYIEWFGFITIPLLSLFAFSLIATILFKINRQLKLPINQEVS